MNNEFYNLALVKQQLFSFLFLLFTIHYSLFLYWYLKR